MGLTAQKVEVSSFGTFFCQRWINLQKRDRLATSIFDGVGGAPRLLDGLLFAKRPQQKLGAIIPPNKKSCVLLAVFYKQGWNVGGHFVDFPESRQIVKENEENF